MSDTENIVEVEMHHKIETTFLTNAEFVKMQIQEEGLSADDAENEWKQALEDPKVLKVFGGRDGIVRVEVKKETYEERRVNAHIAFSA